MSRLILSFCFFFCIMVGVSQNVTIKGVAQKQENKEIGLWVFNDYISKTEKQLTFSAIDSAGNFLLEFDSKEIQYVTLKVDKNVASMYIEPGANYEVILFPPDSAVYVNPNLEHDVKLSINLKSKTEINALTIDYDKRFDEFLSVEYLAFVRRNPQPKIDSFRLATNLYYANVKNPYFDAYVAYTIGSLEEKTQSSEKKLFGSYINGKPVLYNHPEYMDFFNTFYKQKLQKLYLSKNGSDIAFQINERTSYSGLMNVMQLDDYLKNDTIRELVLIKGLYESYYDGTFKRAKIINILQQVVLEAKVPENQRIAQNILNSFSKLQVGVSAPYFELPDKTGRTHRLDEFKNKKYVYLMFYDESCTACLQQMKVIPSLKKQYGSKIEFVSVSADKSNAELAAFCAKNPKYDWLFLYDNTGHLLKMNYEIKSLPAYFLINPEGKFVQAPAESPEGDIERAFYDITKPKGKKVNVGDKRNR
ncbi:MAG: TlpA disulfide reductase family protein [Bacteroidia bacterium]